MSRPVLSIESLDTSSSPEPEPVPLDPADGDALDLGVIPQGGTSQRAALRLRVTDWNTGGSPPDETCFFRNVRVWAERGLLSADDLLIGFTDAWADVNTCALSPAPSAPPVDGSGLPQANAPASWNLSASPLDDETGFLVLAFRKGTTDYPRGTHVLRLQFEGEHS